MTSTAILGSNQRLSLWRAPTLAAVSHFTLELCHNFLPVLYPLLIVSMDLTYGQIGGIALVVTLLTSLPQPFLGFLSDRFGGYKVSALSILWLGVLMSLVGFAPNYIIFAILVGAASLGSSSYHPAGATIAFTLPPDSPVRRGLSMSIFSVGGNIGSALSPIVVAALLPWFGIHAALIFLPITLIVSGLLYGQRPITWTGAATAKGTTQGREGDLLLTAIILLTLASMTRAWFQVSLMTYLPAWIESEGGTLVQASQMLSVLAFAIGGGSMLGGTWSDRVGTWRIAMISWLLIAPAFWLFMHSGGVMPYLAIALIGLCIGNTYPTTLLMGQDCWPRRAAVSAGLIMGTGWAPGGLGAAVTGYMADQSSLTDSLMWLIVPPILGCVFMLLWRVAYRRA
ncbi:MAG: MFS transporter [Chloroflexota bacterium]